MRQVLRLINQQDGVSPGGKILHEEGIEGIEVALLCSSPDDPNPELLIEINALIVFPSRPARRARQSVVFPVPIPPVTTMNPFFSPIP
jgi:hypothetical protein